ncbi:uncharacterized protein LOC131264462 [Anopheles coustani]|uniref:uncharacterized protein LOC131264462 n=1 Tax=Anopheles coustani TaxID=139045 RepID=UPI0026595CC7|nr:uncharacterized protein LOC131264462 [Anopheles coustani]
MKAEPKWGQLKGHFFTMLVFGNEMVRLNAVFVSNIILLFCYFGSGLPTSVNGDDHRVSARALYDILNDESYRLMLAAILEDYLRINSTNSLVAWRNPAFAHYDQKLIIALQSQLEEDDDTYENDQPHADPVSLLPIHGGLKFVTNYCGPGNWSVDGNTVQNSYFSNLDQCCKQHDECPYTIVDRSDYRRYKNLPYKPQLFTRLRCICDVDFIRCLQNIATFFSYAVAWIYTKFQSNCFDYEYPVMKCTKKRNDGIFSTDRCLTYLVNNSLDKCWQWFDLPHLSANTFFFPEVEYYVEQDRFNSSLPRSFETT